VTYEQTKANETKAGFRERLHHLVVKGIVSILQFWGPVHGAVLTIHHLAIHLVGGSVSHIVLFVNCN